jgi:hypothetical protein
MKFLVPKKAEDILDWLKEYHILKLDSLSWRYIC